MRPGGGGLLAHGGPAARAASVGRKGQGRVSHSHGVVSELALSLPPCFPPWAAQCYFRNSELLITDSLL